MQLQGRNLQIRMRGEDVALLHRELTSLGYSPAPTEQTENRFGKTTQDAVFDFQRKHGLPSGGVVDIETAAALSRALETIGIGAYSVRGQVLQADGSPLNGAKVQLFQLEFRQESLVGTAQTDRTGHYAISYPPPQTAPALPGFNIEARVSGVRDVLLARSPVIYAARPSETVHLTITGNVRPRSALEKIQDTLRSVVGEHSLDNLTEDEMAFISRTIGQERGQIERLRNAQQLSREGNIPLEAAYAFVQAGIATRRGLASRKVSELRQILTNALERQVISEHFAELLDTVENQLEQLLVQLAFESPDPGRVAALGEVLTLALPLRPQRETFLRRYANRGDDPESFWQEMRSELGEMHFNRVQRVLQLDALSRSYLPLIRQLEGMFRRGKLRTLWELAAWEEGDWLSFLRRKHQGVVIGAPSDVPGETEKERVQTYARFLGRAVETAFPIASLQHRLEKDEDFASTAYPRFFQRNPQFEIGQQSVSAFLRENPEALADLKPAERNTFTQQLLGVERVFGLARKPEQAYQLMKTGLDSASSLLRLGKWRLTHILNSEPEAILMMEKAKTTAITALGVTAKYSPMYNQITAYVLPSLQSLLEDTDGSGQTNPLSQQSFCSCKHCRSFYSPAAYLVDLLEFLDRFPSEESTPAEPDNSPLVFQNFNLFLPQKVVDLKSKIPKKTARDVLLERRRDIAQLELSCANTNTLIPYVDLVNEILEHAIAQESFPSRIAVKGTADELAAHPQPLNPSAQETAYTILAQQRYPWSLPFNLYAQETDIYLEHLGVPRHQVMTAFYRLRGQPSTDLAVASAYLGITTEQRNAIFDDREPWQTWGLARIVNGEPWYEVLKPVPEILSRAKLGYSDLQELLELRFINSLNQLKIEAKEGQNPNTCDIDQLQITGAAERDWIAALARIQAFVRLQRILGWKMVELDKSLTSFQITTLTEDVLVKLAQIEQLQKRLKISLVTLLSWWSPLDIQGWEDKPSLYERLFLNKAVRNPVDEAFKIPLVTDPDTTERLLDHAETIQAALRIQADDLALLTDPIVSGQSHLNNLLPPEALLTLENLSALHRMAACARALRLNVRDILILQALSGLNPFDPRDLDQARQFLDLAEALKTTGIRVVDLDYLLRHTISLNTSIAPDENTLQTILNNLASELARLRTEMTPITEDLHTQQAQLENWLGQLTVTQGTENKTTTFPIAQVIQVIVEKSESGAEEIARTILLNTLSAFLNLQEATEVLDDLVGEDVEKDPSKRILFVSQPLAQFLFHRSGTAAILQILGEAVGLDSDLTYLLLEQLLLVPESPDQAALNAFLQAENQDIQRTILSRLFQCAWIISTLEIAAPELVSFLNLVGLDLNSLPAESSPSASNYVSFIRLVHVVRLRNGLPSGSLLDILTALQTPDPEIPVDVVSVLSEKTGWPLDDLTTLIGPDGWFVIPFADLRLDEQLQRLQTCFALLKRLGLSANAVLPLTQPDESVEAARLAAAAVKHAAKAKYDETQWLEIAQPLRDRLREQQRDALVDYLLWRDGHSNTHELFARLLVDVEMDPCMMTSRIKLAISSVQLFIQRSFLRLEDSVKLDDEARAEWEWMKVYRIWEANRKVFLYPENWIEPELRDDKSPFFKELESELMQGDLNNERAEQAIRNYLNKLDQVARLEIVGMFHEEDNENDISFVHVFGRTYSEPHRYFYRCLSEDTHWTAWEKVDLDIHGNHLIPVVFKQRLYLFWPIFKENSDKNSLEISMEWSEYRHKKWLSKQKAKEAVVRVNPAQMLQMQSIFFQTHIRYGEINQLIIDCCLNVKAIHRITGTAEDLDVSLFQSLEDKHPLLGSFMMTDLSPNLFATSRDLSAEMIPGEIMEVVVQTNSPVGTTPSYMYYREDLNFWGNNTAEKGLILDLNSGLSHSVQSGIVFFKKSPPDLFRVLSPVHKTSGSSPLLKSTDKNALIKYFFYQDEERTFFAQFRKLEIFYHPFANHFIQKLNTNGIAGLLSWKNRADSLQFKQQFFFETTYLPEDITKPFPEDEVDFTDGGVYALYNWELFFQIPLLIARRLSQNQRFEEAQNWYHYIFDPTTGSDENDFRRFWKVRPFYENTDLDNIEKVLQEGGEDLVKQVNQWRINPFMPHLLARQRLIAYQKNVVMKYIDNLIAWADYLFRRDTIESINEATQLYILAADILGKKPIEIPPRGEAGDRTYQELAPFLDKLSNALMPVENLVLTLMPQTVHQSAPLSETLVSIKNNLTPGQFTSLSDHFEDRFAGMTKKETNKAKGIWVENDISVAANQLADKPANMEHLLSVANSRVFYFCIPPNDKWLEYWALVADRLFKIRHCMNIEGVIRQLPLFEPPIDPALLVKAKAVGLELSSVLDDLYGPTPFHRFQFLAQKALEMVSEIKQLGNALLSALEKRDAEALVLLRSTHEVALLQAIRQIKKDQIKEANETLSSLTRSRKIAEHRFTHYANVEKFNAGEILHMTLSATATTTEVVSEGIIQSAASIHSTPDEFRADIQAGYTTGTFGFRQAYKATGIANSTEAIGRAVGIVAKLLREGASLAATLAGYERRWQDWKLQQKLAELEMKQTDKQIAAAEIRIQIFENELSNHELQTENAQEIDAFMRQKFTNQELYNWMVGQISTIYFQTYKLAYDLAKRAERAYRHELGLQSSDFIQFGYWDSLTKGLLAGEKLHLDLKRMETAYLEQNKREFEITKHISLVQLAPEVLIQLRQTGSCEVSIPEAFFDLDFPGHYMRRIKTVSLSIPAVTGPYTGVPCTLSLIRSSTRIKSTLLNGDGSTQNSGQYRRDDENDDPRFIDSYGVIQSIVTSSGQNDSGLFETNLRDERFLPFEGAGAISTWRLELSEKFRPFDYQTISDVLIHFRYTARAAGGLLKVRAVEELAETVSNLAKSGDEKGLARLFSLRHEFPTEWHRFLNPANEDTVQQILLPLTQERFPFLFRGHEIQFNQMDIFVKVNEEFSESHTPQTLKFTLSPETATQTPPLSLNEWNGLSKGTKLDIQDVPGNWQLTAWLGDEPDTGTHLNPKALDNLWIVVYYRIE